MFHRIYEEEIMFDKLLRVREHLRIHCTAMYDLENANAINFHYLTYFTWICSLSSSNTCDDELLRNVCTFA